MRIHSKYRRCVHWQKKANDAEDKKDVTCKRCLARFG
jgi:hypothetical protein